MLKLVYNPLRFIPYFAVEKSQIELHEDELVILEKNGDEINKIQSKINHFKPEQKHKIFFMFWELFLLAICVLYILFAFLITKTDLITFLVWFVGMGTALYFCKNRNFVLAEILIALTSLICLITLYMFFKNLEIVFNHVGILFVGYFIISYVLYNLDKKREIIRPNDTIWGEISSYKFFIIYDNERK